MMRKMITDLPGDDLFVGQIIAVTPLERVEADVLADTITQSVFVGSDDADSEPPESTRRRRRTYSIVTYAPRRGIFLLGRHEIEVSIDPLDVDTPLQATIFRIVSVSGRSLRVTRAVVDAPQEGLE